MMMFRQLVRIANMVLLVSASLGVAPITFSRSSTPEPCGSSIFMGQASANSAQSGCASSQERVTSGYFKDSAKGKTVSNGPKIRYSVTYFRQCEPALVNLMGCDANTDAPCPDGSYPLMRLIQPLNGPRQGQSISRQSYCTSEPPTDCSGSGPRHRKSHSGTV